MRAPSAAARQPNDFALTFGEGWLSGIGLGARSERCGSLVNARHWPNGTAASAVLRDVAHDYTDLRPGVRLEDAGAGVRCCLGAAAGVDRRGGVGGGRPTLDPMPSHAELGLLGPSTAPIGRLHYHRIASNRTLSSSTPSCLISPQASLPVSCSDVSTLSSCSCSCASPTPFPARTVLSKSPLP